MSYFLDKLNLKSRAARRAVGLRLSLNPVSVVVVIILVLLAHSGVGLIA